MSKTEFCTIGYEGRTLVEFIEALTNNKVKQVIDVRHITSSRKKGFSKNLLAEALEKSGIGYIGMIELGTQDEMRRAYKAGGSVEKFVMDYAKYIDTQPEKLEELRRHVRERHSAIMCYERDPNGCHRMILAKVLEAEGFRVNHIP